MDVSSNLNTARFSLKLVITPSSKLQQVMDRKKKDILMLKADPIEKTPLKETTG